MAPPGESGALKINRNWTAKLLQKAITIAKYIIVCMFVTQLAVVTGQLKNVKGRF